MNSAETDLTSEEPQGSRTMMEKKPTCVHVAHPLIHGAFTFNCPIIVFLYERELLPDYSCDVNSNEE